jgi:hypothetical protein
MVLCLGSVHWGEDKGPAVDKDRLQVKILSKDARE